MRAPPILWAAAGHPDPRRKPSLATGRCHWCATPIDGPCCRVDDVLSDSFTDQDQALVRSSPLLCAGCTWAMTGRPPDTLRLWSVAWTEEPRGWPANHPSAPTLGASIHLQNKAGPAAFRALLREPPPGRWLCSVADSGQIHTLPFAPVNVGAQRFGVRFERSTITTSAAEYRPAKIALVRWALTGEGAATGPADVVSALERVRAGKKALDLVEKQLLATAEADPMLVEVDVDGTETWLGKHAKPGHEKLDAAIALEAAADVLAVPEGERVKLVGELATITKAALERAVKARVARGQAAATMKRILTTTAGRGGVTRPTTESVGLYQIRRPALAAGGK